MLQVYETVQQALRYLKLLMHVAAAAALHICCAMYMLTHCHMLAQLYVAAHRIAEVHQVADIYFCSQSSVEQL